MASEVIISPAQEETRKAASLVDNVDAYQDG